jgi:Mrp family chromosome partitioning ATPase
VQSQSSLEAYLRAIRAYWPLVIAVTVAALSASVAMVTLRSPKYEATSRLLVTPLPQDDRTFLGLPVLRDSGDPTRTVQTAATLVKSPDAASLTADRIGHGWTRSEVLDAVSVQPEGATNILDITATAGNAEGAARLANQYARAALDVRRALLRQQVVSTIARLQARSVKSAEDAARLSDLQAVRDGQDPTLGLSQQATIPGSPTGTPASLIVFLALVAGFTLGSGAALLRSVLDRRIHDEDELVRLYPLPVLARVPAFPRLLRRPGGNSQLAMPQAVRAAFRSLATQLDEGTHRRTIMVTSPSSGDGKTFCAVGLALALVADGWRVVLMDLDIHKPDVGGFLGVRPQEGAVSAYSDKTALSDLLVPAPGLPSLLVAPAHPGNHTLADSFARALPELLAEARPLADYVVIDTPPLGEVSEALRIARQADEILVTSRLGNTDRGNLASMRDLLERAGRVPAGFVVFGKSGNLAAAYPKHLRPSAEAGERTGLPQPSAY